MFFKSVLKFITNCFSSFFVIYILLILVFSLIVVATNYNNPKSAYWDENFHIVAAEKYLQNSFYMEPHPPLGKLFIALGEKITKSNDCISTSTNCFPANYIAQTDGYKDIYGQIRDKSDYDLYQECLKKTDKCISKQHFLTTDYTSLWPLDYSFVGARLFPVFFSSFLGLLFFFLIRGLTKNDHFAFFGSFFLIFDNAMVLHFRGAMLDGILAFFCLASLVCFVNIWNNDSKFFGNNLLNWTVLGILVGCSYMTKVTGLFLLIFVLALLTKEFWENKNTNWKILVETLLKKILAFGFGFLLIFGSVWAIHLNNTKNIDSKHPLVADINAKINSWETDLKENRQNPNFNQDQLKSNIEIYQTFLNDTNNKNFNLINGIRAQLLYADLYAKGVPKLDVKKADENGSYPTNWPVGNKTISYRWQATSVDASGNTDFKFVAYSYLVANPVIWFVGLVGVLLSTVLVLGKWIFGFEIQEKRTFILLNIFWFSWVGYMLAVLRIDRVMYLYHYFPPLIISFVLAILCFQLLSKNQIIKEKLDYFGIFISILAFATFLFYAPFTYSIPIDCEGFRSRNAFEFWQMKSVNKIDGKDCPLYQKN